jgi:GNAT superfamily N-acetyltransferase
MSKTHCSFVEDDSRAVLYCYEIQVEKDYQKRGVGTILIRMLEQLGKGLVTNL